MLTITPIQNYKYQELPANAQSRPVFNQKSGALGDAFERVSKPIAFKGFKTSELAEKFLAPVLKATEINEKLRLFYDFIDHYEKKVLYFYTDTSGATHDYRIQPDKNIRELMRDRAHEIGYYMANSGNSLSDLQAQKKPANEYDKVIQRAFNGMVGVIERYEFFMQKGLQNNTMKPEDVFRLAMDSVIERANARGVKILVEGENVLAEHQNGIFTPEKRVPDYKLYTLQSNLLQNGVKYTRDGSIVNVKHAEQVVEGEKYLTFSVRDEGIGISDEDWVKALEGERAQNAIDLGIPGTGYGLRRVRKIIQNLQRRCKVLEKKSPLNPENAQYPGTEITAFLRLKD